MDSSVDIMQVLLVIAAVCSLKYILHVPTCSLFCLFDCVVKGLVLMGFKPKNLIKPYFHVRPAQFLYPDETVCHLNCLLHINFSTSATDHYQFIHSCNVIRLLLLSYDENVHQVH